jgi:DNA modification methylase
MSWAILQGDARRIPLKDESVQCVVTSPSYWGLRDYGVVGQIGLEETLKEYVSQILIVFREVWRVLRVDGTAWLNLGDTYFGGYIGNSGPLRPWDKQSTNIGSWSTRRRDTGSLSPSRRGGCDNLKVKDLCGVPWMVAFALRSDGWWLRRDIIWAKNNPMTESVKDRPSSAHEYIFLLSKSERYYYDADAIAEPATCERLRGSGPMVQPGTGRNDANRNGDYRTNGKWSVEHPQSSGRRLVENVKRARAYGADHDSPFGDTRNKRSVWTMNTQSFPEAHFATFPEELPETCIKAGSRPGDIVLDPFAGAGTTPLVADKLNRRGIGLELKGEYCRMGARRCFDDAPLLA